MLDSLVRVSRRVGQVTDRFATDPESAGIAAAILQDFCTRLKTAGYETIKTHFFLRRFYQKQGFRLDERWGGLVRFLTP